MIENQNKINIQELKTQGKTKMQIVDELKLHYNTVIYWYSEDTRTKKKERQRKWAKKKYSSMTVKQRQEERKQKREYNRDYHKNRYHEDKDFREKQKKATRDYQKACKEKSNE